MVIAIVFLKNKDIYYDIITTFILFVSVWFTVVNTGRDFLQVDIDNKISYQKFVIISTNTLKKNHRSTNLTEISEPLVLLLTREHNLEISLKKCSSNKHLIT